MEPRYSHTAAVFGSGHNCRMVVMYGGRRKVGGPAIAETTLLYLGEWMLAIYDEQAKHLSPLTVFV